jgi:RHS repeat-associated protein
MRRILFKYILLLIIALSGLTYTAKAQFAIQGNTCAAPGNSETYTLSGSILGSDYLSWTINGGVITGTSSTAQSGNVSSIGLQISITWSQTSGAYVEVTNSRLGTVRKNIAIAGLAIGPISQSVNIGASASIYPVSSDAPGCTNSYQWQYSYSSSAGPYTSIPGANLPYYTTTPVTQPTYFIRQTVVNGLTYYTNTVFVDLLPFNAGSISLSASVPYNSIPVINQSPASGGCIPTSYIYQWEQSIENGQWTIIGTAENYPAGASAIIGNTQVRRKVTCSGLGSLYTNILSISPVYVSVDYENRNYVRTIAVVKNGIQSYFQADQLPIGDKLQSTIYFDGLGRAIQSVNKEVTPGANNTWNDLVKHFEYDAAGRTTKDFLTYPTTEFAGKFKTNAATAQPAIIQSLFNEPVTAPTYSLAEYDNSPLNRLVKAMGPGQSRAGSGVGVITNYDFNNSNTINEKVHIWNLDFTAGAIPVTNPTLTYSAGKLSKQTLTDENGNKVINYIDFFGHVILKKVQEADPSTLSQEHAGWICTYYVYDDFGMLRFIITPNAVQYLDNNGWNLTQAVTDELCYSYLYDAKGRTIRKKNPGAQPLTMLYDVRDRIVFTQDGNQALLSPPQWAANIYDEWDRPVITTLYNTAKTPAQLQNDINNAYTGPVTITNPGQSIDILTVNLRQAGITSYKATNTVYLVADAGGEFESLPGDEFTAEIDPAAAAGPINITAAVLKNPIPVTDLNNLAVCTVLSYQFYDNYSFTRVKIFDNNFTNTTAYSTTDPNVQPIVKTGRTTGMATGSMTRVLGSNTFLAATHYYDERGSLIQTQQDNIKTATDITTLQYHFDGRLLSTCNDHTATDGYTNFKTLTKYFFDKTGRTISIQKQWGSNAFKTITSYDYDELGRVKTKHLDPGYTAGGNADLESLNYSYNILNQLTGINKDYALKTPATYNKWGHFFGMYLGFDNRDNVFANANLLGQVTGQLWSTQGDDAQRKYDYKYDRAGRLENAFFNEKQHTGDSWSNTQMDFSVSGTNGKITYDLNDNLLNMLQKGVLPGAATPITVDNLTYTYASLSNKLQSVTDNMTNTTANGGFGDFKDGANGATPDYVYDANGNVVIDLNKNAKDLANVAGANGVKYNYLDKPEEIRIAGKGTIKIVYSADGGKLQRKFISEIEDKIKITTYINQFIYEETTTISGNVLTPFGIGSINFEEGRIRIITPTSQGNGLDALTVDGNMDLPGGKRGAYDYFITDHLQNTRMILTEETHIAGNTATMEGNRSVLEESIFGQIGGANEVATTRWPTASTSWTGNTSSSVSRVGTLSGYNIGPNTLQKVMAGDKVNATVQYYYQAAPGGNNTNFVNTVLSSLTTAITGGNAASSIVKGNAMQVSTQLSGMGGFINAVQPNGSNPGGTTPQAFLTILFFDERFNLISAADGGVAQQQVSSSFVPLTLPNVKAPKNGYAYIYVSNQSNNDVYFDNLAATIIQGNIAEENHYYAYGLKIAALSSKKLGDVYEGSLKNNYLYQGGYSELDDDIGWHDFALRNYDAQTGRWMQQDPYDEFPSPYIGMGNDPISNVDPTGGWLDGLSAFSQFAIKHFAPALIGAVVGAATTKGNASDKLQGAAWGFGIGMAASYLATEVNWGGVAGAIGDVGVGGTIYFDVNGNILHETKSSNYRRAFIINNQSLEGFKKVVSQFGNREGFDGALLLVNSTISSFGDAYDLNSINEFFEENVNKYAIQSIGGYNIDDMIDIKLDGKPISKEYLKGIKGAEVSFDMIQKSGVWTVDKNSISTLNDLTASNQARYSTKVPNGHLHPFVKGLLGKTITFKTKLNKREIAFGPFSISPGPSTGGDGDTGIAKRQGKLENGTIRNVLVNSRHIWLYHEYRGILINR